ncbi:MAG TPA: 3-hydroxyacyl-ACP dehydratase FabZ [Chitinispirillaceae bacterium]|nr:3-hydroxyacyl-ACP dehydratase FabZ [Chitinispirillaceae bacterium]
MEQIQDAIKSENTFANSEIKVTCQDILDILPHRYPFLLVDEVLEIVPKKSIVAVKNISFNENFFQGHFPGHPILPGFLEVEAMAQAIGIMGLFGEKTTGEKPQEVLFLSVDKARFRGNVHPGSRLRMELKMLQFRKGIGKAEGKCFVGEKLVCEAELMAMFGI